MKLKATISTAITAERQFQNQSISLSLSLSLHEHISRSKTLPEQSIESIKIKYGFRRKRPSTLLIQLAITTSVESTKNLTESTENLRRAVKWTENRTESTEIHNNYVEQIVTRRESIGGDCVMNLLCGLGEAFKEVLGMNNVKKMNKGTMEESQRIVLRKGTEWSAEVVLNGSLQIVVSWKSHRKEELLFLSKKATGKPHEARRGGIEINICAVERHGFARNRIWTLDKHDPSPLPPAGNDEEAVDLVLEPKEDQETCSHSVESRLRISISARKITLVPRVRNLDSEPFSFTLALRNYIYVADISDVRVEGLETLDYLDNLSNRERCTEQEDAITFDEDQEIDRVYLSTPDQIAITDYKRKLTYILQKQGMPDTVVWSPGKEKAKALPDLGKNEYKTMLCFDSAVIEQPKTLRPGEEWKGCQRLEVVPSSYYEGKMDRIIL